MTTTAAQPFDTISTAHVYACDKHGLVEPEGPEDDCPHCGDVLLRLDREFDHGHLCDAVARFKQSVRNASLIVGGLASVVPGLLLGLADNMIHLELDFVRAGLAGGAVYGLMMATRGRRISALDKALKATAR
jgi:hypothetical protein